MFYVSSVIDKDRKIGVTDTRDGVEEFNKKIKYFEDFQNGADLWSYNYKC